MKSIKMFKMLNGEMVITEVEGVNDEGMLILIYPSIVVPMNDSGQIGFGRYLPFSDYKKDILLNPACIAADTEPTANLLSTYEQWVTQTKAQDSGIIMAGSMPKQPATGNKVKDFPRLNLGR